MQYTIPLSSLISFVYRVFLINNSRGSYLILKWVNQLMIASDYLCMLDSQANANQYGETISYLILTTLENSSYLFYAYEINILQVYGYTL